MSYEREGFDPTNTELDEYDGLQIEHLTVHGLDVHIIDVPKIIEKSASQDVQLVDSDLTGGDRYGSLGAVRLDATVGPHLSGGLPARLYRGAVTLGAHTGGMTHFADHVSHDDFGDVAIRQYGKKPNKQLITDPTGVFTTALVYKPGKHVIRMANELLPKNARHSEGVLYAPANEAVDDKRAQLIHFVSSLIIGAHLGNNVRSGGCRPLEAEGLIITPEGPLYEHPDSGAYVHNLKREVIVAGGDDDEPHSPSRKAKSESANDGPAVPKESFGDLYGIDGIKQALRPLIAYYRYPEVMKEWNIDRPPSGVLIQGPAGTGKTTIVRALAHEIGATLSVISPSDVSKPYIGEAEAAMQRVFDQVRDADKPAIVFFDELDASISSNNKGSDSGAYKQNAVAAIFKKETAEIAASNPNVIFAAATNFPERIDEGLIRAGRFDLKLTVGLPDETARTQMLRNMIIQESVGKVAADKPDISPEDFADPVAATESQAGRLPLFTDDILDAAAIQELVRVTDGFTGADIKTLLRQTKLDKALGQVTTGHATPISLHDLRQHIVAQRRS